jgi:sec-independent protein translocase protein TatC
MLLGFGLIFQLPLIIIFLTEIRVVSPKILKTKRPYVIVLIFIVAAILTPPDVFTQFLMAIPLIILYELSILVSYLFYKK